ncbi:MAG TPA: DUF881 domain-containing protein [Acidimicrobiales bacterium]|nr:DUF881 domain-containing protein [Acidimicrobiales bacterium]
MTKAEAGGEQVAGGAPRRRTSRLGWFRRSTLIRLAVLVAASVVGFLVVGQVRTTRSTRGNLSGESEADLARILSDRNTTSDNLRDQVGALKLQLFGLQNSSERDQTATQAALDQLRALRVLAGTVAATGPGINVTVDDPESAVRYDVTINLIEELRDAGAEAIAINEQRVGATTAFGPGDRGLVLIGPGTPNLTLRGPYHVVAIGEPATLDTALSIPGGALDALRAERGVQVAVQRAARVDVAALPAAPSFRAARPVGSGA